MLLATVKDGLRIVSEDPTNGDLKSTQPYWFPADRPHILPIFKRFRV